MNEKTLIISDKKADLGLFEEILGPRGFDIELTCSIDKIEKTILEDIYTAILVDYDFIGNKILKLIELLQQSRSKSCLIVYGKTIKTDEISEILQKGVYGFVPRELLSTRIYDTISGGLENRKAFIDILAMIDELKDVNEKLKKEKEAFKAKNQELSFINRLTTEVAYDLNWNRILPRILDAGLLDVIDPELISILYKIGSEWNLAIYLSQKEINKEILKKLKKDMVDSFCRFSKEKIVTKELVLRLYPYDAKVSCSSSVSLSKSTVGSFLTLAGKPLGMFVIITKNKREPKKELEELISTMSNILSMSLKNAQEYHSLKEMTVRDGLTGIYNYKGFKDFLNRELERAKRYNKSLSLIMFDVDNFKLINDSFGHLAGDYVLRELAYCLNSSLRKTDIVARYGGDEFVVLLPEAPLDKAEVFLKRILQVIKNHAFMWGSESIKVEISYGVSTTAELKEKSEESLIHIADSRLYNVKNSRTFLNAAQGV